jgi:hypothetical protein
VLHSPLDCLDQGGNFLASQISLIEPQAQCNLMLVIR